MLTRISRKIVSKYIFLSDKNNGEKGVDYYEL